MLEIFNILQGTSKNVKCGLIPLLQKIVQDFEYLEKSVPEIKLQPEIYIAIKEIEKILTKSIPHIKQLIQRACKGGIVVMKGKQY